MDIKGLKLKKLKPNVPIEKGDFYMNGDNIYPILEGWIGLLPKNIHKLKFYRETLDKEK